MKKIYAQEDKVKPKILISSTFKGSKMEIDGGGPISKSNGEGKSNHQVSKSGDERQ